MNSIKFTKMHSAGNDYVFVNATQAEVDNPSALSVAISDRHKGVGSDGLVLLTPSKVADFAMRMFNSDGSEGSMCGNASICLGKFIFDQKLTSKNVILLETKSGIKVLSLTIENNEVSAVKVDMGEPILDSKLIPVLCDSPEMLMCPVETSRGVFPLTSISMGNPHTVIFCNDVDAIDVHGIGAEIENSPLFPDKVNVEFVKIISPVEIEMRVWERGSGETLACGTGACASVVAGVITGKTSRKVLVHLKGGDLHVDWESTNNHVYLSGHGVSVFEGIYLI
ncbi:MAG: diaminopimelate epimerase [Muribaculaceae bacterium]|nr:diaminopimelate epimerase [Bacteroidales bacterium]MDY2931277.1 diaminopimelate epimerase [Muribaculaceae bacterium]MDY4882739.1 diaminopimelate epimerase [Muribaculaceae bacterium]MDY5118942.1 diaminopimelate epimerase [Muribaculaceae bacterium]